MEENNEFVLKIIKRKIYSVGLLIPVVICLMLMLIVLFVAEPATPDDEFARFFIAGFFMIFVIVFGGSFYNKNKAMRNAIYIKENGKKYNGRVINIQKRYVRTSKNTKVYTDLLVEFQDGFDYRYIVATNFPYELKLKGKSGLFDYRTKSDDLDEDSMVTHSQYRSRGYVTFDNHDNLGRIFTYEGSKHKNYLENDLTCTVFELDGKYVVDDYIGYDKSKVMTAKLINIILPLLFFAAAVAVFISNR